MTKIPGTNKHIRKATIANNPKKKKKDSLQEAAEKFDRKLKKAAKKIDYA